MRDNVTSTVQRWCIDSEVVTQPIVCGEIVRMEKIEVPCYILEICLERLWKNCKALFQKFSLGTEENHEKFQFRQLASSRESNRGRTEYEVVVLTGEN
jgi:hypothetical protein